MPINQITEHKSGLALPPASGAGEAPDPLAAKKAQAELLLKAKAAEAALAAATAMLTSDEEASAKLEAARGDLPHDDAAIAAHVQKESVARIKVDLARRAYETARATKAELDAAVERSVIETRYAQILEARQRHLTKFFAEFGPSMRALKDLLTAGGDLDAEIAELNKRLPKGVKPLGAAFGFEAAGAPAHLEVHLLDARRHVLWAGDEESGPAGGDR